MEMNYSVLQAVTEINKDTRLMYILEKNEEGYSLICTELDKGDRIIDSASTRVVTKSRKKAEGLFHKIVNEKVCPCTLCDIICDIIC